MRLLLVLALLSLPLAVPLAASAQAPLGHAQLAGVFSVDTDDSGDLTCGDQIQYNLSVNGSGTAPLEGVRIEIPMPANGILQPTTLTTFNPNPEGGPVVVRSGNHLGDSFIRVDLGRVCTPNTCSGPPWGAGITFRVLIADPNPFTTIPMQALLTGTNFPASVSDDITVPGESDPTLLSYPPCPGGGGGSIAVSATKVDSLSFDADGDGQADEGDTVRYTVQIRNTGTLTAPQSTFLSGLDPASSLVVGSVTASQGTVAEGNTTGNSRVRVDLGTLTASLVTVRFDARVRSGLPAGISRLSCQGIVSGPNFPPVATDDPALPGPADPTLTPLDFDADLALAKSDGGATVPPGEVVTYTLTLANHSTHTAAHGTLVTETVPLHTRFEAAASSPGWACSPGPQAGSTCTLGLGQLDPGAVVTPRFAARADTVLPPGFATLTNTASVTFDPADGPDPTPGDNQATDTTPLALGSQAPDLSLGKDDLGASVAPGEAVVYLLTFANAGTRGATGVVLTEQVPTYSSFEPAGSSPGWSCSGTVCTLPVGSLLAGTSASRRFAVRADAQIPPGVTFLTNTASIADNGEGGPDPTPANNQATDTTPLLGSPSLSLLKTLDPDSEPRAGGLLRWRLSYANHGSAAADNVELRETVPIGTRFEVGASVGWDCDGIGGESPCVFSLGTVPPGASGTVLFPVRVDDPLGQGLDAIENCAELLALGGPAGVTPILSCANTPVDAAPDLGLTKSDGEATTRAGQTVIYTLRYRNVGNQTATGVVLTETVPQHSRFAPAGSAPWVCEAGGGPGSLCRLAVGTVLGGGTTGAAPFAVLVEANLPPELEQLVNQALVADDGTNGADPDPINNLATDTTPIDSGGGGGPEPELHAFKADALLEDLDGNGYAGPGERIRYTVEIRNDGEGAALSVLFRSPAPEDTLLAAGSVTTTQGAVTLGNHSGDTSVQVDLGDLPPHGRAVVTFDVRVEDPLSPAVRVLVCQGTLDAGNAPHLPTDDPDTLEPLDPTLTTVLFTAGDPGGRAVDIPTLGWLGLVVLGFVLSGVAILFLHRPSGSSGV